MKTVFVVYDWSSNCILATPTKDSTNDTMVEAFKTNIRHLSEIGFNTVFNIIYNLAYRAIKTYFEKEDIKLQLVEPHNHWENASEIDIQNFNYNFISGLCIGYPKFLTVLWSYIVRQYQDSLNMLHKSKVHPKLFAYHVLEGVHDFNRHPWAPPAKKVTIFNTPETRSSWGARAVYVWYLNPLWNHYRCITFIDIAAGGINISGRYTLYTHHYTMPIGIPMD